MIVDYDGRVLSQADAGPGEKIVVASVDIAALRAERERRSGHHMLAHLRSESHALARRPVYPGVQGGAGLNVAGNERAIEQGKTALANQRLFPCKRPPLA
jgi:hypothetical protein